MRRLFISPHPDDIAFSCGGYLRKVCLGAANTLLTVFTRSGWHASKGRRPDLVDEISKIRSEEDAKFSSWAMCLHHKLDFPDSSARGYAQGEEYVSAVGADPILKKLHDAFESVLSAIGPVEAVYAPLGVGNHIDHLLVRHVVCSLWKNRDQLIFYEELPHASRLSEKHIEMLAHEIFEEPMAVIVDISQEWASKIEAVRLYASQIGRMTISGISMHAARVGGGNRMAERFWVSSTSRDLVL